MPAASTDTVRLLEFDKNLSVVMIRAEHVRSVNRYDALKLPWPTFFPCKPDNLEQDICLTQAITRQPQN